MVGVGAEGERGEAALRVVEVQRDGLLLGESEGQHVGAAQGGAGLRGGEVVGVGGEDEGGGVLVGEERGGEEEGEVDAGDVAEGTAVCGGGGGEVAVEEREIIGEERGGRSRGGRGRRWGS